MAKFKEMSGKKKFFICAIILVLIVVAVFLIVKFAFPEVDVNEPYTLAREVSSSSEEDIEIKSALNFFSNGEKCNQHVEAGVIAHFGELVEQRVGQSGDLLNATIDVEDVNKLKKKIKVLKQQKDNVQDKKDLLVEYYDNHLNGYDGGDKTLVDQYYYTFMTKYVDYLGELIDFEKKLTDVINNCSVVNSYSNDLTKFMINLNNLYIENCHETLSKKIQGEAVSIDVLPKGTLFSLKENALEIYLNDVSVCENQLGNIRNASWLAEWAKVYRTGEEDNFSNGLDEIGKLQYSEFIAILNQYFNTPNSTEVA